MDDGMTLLVVNEVHAVRGDGVPVGVFRAATNVLRAARAPSYAQCVELLLRLVRRSSMPYLIAPRSAARHVERIDEAEKRYRVAAGAKIR